MFIISGLRGVYSNEPITPIIVRFVIFTNFIVLGAALGYLYTIGYMYYIDVFFNSILFIVFANILLYISGITGVASAPMECSILRYYGISIERVKFYLSYGINSYSVYPAIGAIYSISKLSKPNIHIQ